MKVHVGTDERGIVDTLTTTHAAEADVNQLPNLVHGDERQLTAIERIGTNRIGAASKRSEYDIG